jgi:hypothetical protein
MVSVPSPAACFITGPLPAAVPLVTGAVRSPRAQQCHNGPCRSSVPSRTRTPAHRFFSSVSR